jgi:hypothetical protein
MADRSAFGVAGLAIVCVLVEVALIDAGLSLPLLVTALAALTSLAVAAGLAWSLGLAGQRRLIKGFVLVPVVFSALTIVVLIFEARFQTRGWP